MKKLILIPLLLVTCFCFAQDAKQIIGKPVKIDNILVAQNDFSDEMKWEEAKTACTKLGKGWRLPTIEELNILYTKRKFIGRLKNDNYWSSSSSVNYYDIVWVLNFCFGDQETKYADISTNYVRAVKSL